MFNFISNKDAVAMWKHMRLHEEIAEKIERDSCRTSFNADAANTPASNESKKSKKSNPEPEPLSSSAPPLPW